MQLISAVIANHNQKFYLRSCLHSLLHQTYQPLEIVVVDNASSDGSLEMLQEEFPQVHFLVNEENKFYCQAQNQGIRVAKGDYIVCLNNDVVLEHDFIEKLFAAAQRDPAIGMVCGKVLSWDRKRIDSAGQILTRSRKPLERGYKRKDVGKFDQPGYIFGASGVAPLYKRMMLEEIRIESEYFDQDYDMFYEDLDMAWRANSFGWRAFYVPTARAYHKRGATAKTHPPRLRLLKRFYFSHLHPDLKAAFVKNRYMTMLKNEKAKHFLCNLPWILAYEIKLWSYLILFHPRLIPKVLKNFSFLKKAWAKRQKIKIMKNEKEKI